MKGQDTVLHRSACHDVAGRVLESQRRSRHCLEDEVEVDRVGRRHHGEFGAEQRAEDAIHLAGGVAWHGRPDTIPVVDAEAVDVHHVAQRIAAVVEHVDPQGVIPRSARVDMDGDVECQVKSPGAVRVSRIGWRAVIVDENRCSPVDAHVEAATSRSPGGDHVDPGAEKAHLEGIAGGAIVDKPGQ